MIHEVGHFLPQGWVGVLPVLKTKQQRKPNPNSKETKLAPNNLSHIGLTHIGAHSRSDVQEGRPAFQAHAGPGLPEMPDEVSGLAEPRGIQEEIRLRGCRCLSSSQSRNHLISVASR